MNTGLFTIQTLEDGVAALQIATDDEPHLGEAWVRRFAAALDALAADVTLRVVVLRGGNRVFCAGANRDGLLQAGGAELPTTYAGNAARALLAMPVPVVASMSGHAVGGGLVLGLLCDAVVLAEQSLYGANFMALGLTPGMGATAVVEEAFGPLLGRQLLMTGELLTGRDIKQAQCPLSQAVYPRDAVEERTAMLARDIAGAPREALLLLKETFAHARRAAIAQALVREADAHARLFADPQTIERIATRYVRGANPAESS